MRSAGLRGTGQRRSQFKVGAKRLGATGWEFVHVCFDDATRLAYVDVLDDEKATTALAFLERDVAFYQARGIAAQQVMTDNGAAYRSIIHAIACRALKLKPLRTRAYRPRTNGKADASSKCSRPAARRAPSTAPRPNDEPHYPAGSTGTTPDDPSAPSATSRPSGWPNELNNLLGSYI